MLDEKKSSVEKNIWLLNNPNPPAKNTIFLHQIIISPAKIYFLSLKKKIGEADDMGNILCFMIDFLLKLHIYSCTHIVLHIYF